MMRPKIIFKFIAKKFWLPFFFSIGIFSALVIFGDVFDNLRSITNGYATFPMILKYALLNMPGWLGILLPAACLIACLFVISDMVGSGEWTACVAGGYRPLQLFTPLIACVLFVVLLNLTAQEYIFPTVSQKAETLFRVKLRGKKDYNPNKENNITMRISDSVMLFAQEAQTNSDIMKGITVGIYKENLEIETQLVAKYMEWNGKEWLLKNAVKRDFDENGISIKEEVFEEYPAPLKVSPQQIVFGKTDEKLSKTSDLFKKIKFLEKSGLQTYKEKTLLHNRFAMPFITLLMCLLCMPFATTGSRKKGKALNIILAVVVCFFVWWLMSMGVSAGENGMLNPVLAGWLIVIICSVIVFIEYRFLKV